MNIRSNKGFTIIELVVVIAILGVLAAVAMPKFASLESKARTASLEGVRGGFTASLQISHAKWLADGSGAADTALALDGAYIRVNSLGWPTVDTLGAGPVQNTALKLYELLMAGTFPGSGWSSTQGTLDNFGAADFTLAGAGGGSFCYDAAKGVVKTGTRSGTACP